MSGYRLRDSAPHSRSEVSPDHLRQVGIAFLAVIEYSVYNFIRES